MIGKSRFTAIIIAIMMLTASVAAPFQALLYYAYAADAEEIVQEQDAEASNDVNEEEKAEPSDDSEEAEQEKGDDVITDDLTGNQSADEIQKDNAETGSRMMLSAAGSSNTTEETDYSGVTGDNLKAAVESANSVIFYFLLPDGHTISKESFTIPSGYIYNSRSFVNEALESYNSKYNLNYERSNTTDYYIYKAKDGTVDTTGRKDLFALGEKTYYTDKSANNVELTGTSNAYKTKRETIANDIKTNKYVISGGDKIVMPLKRKSKAEVMYRGIKYKIEVSGKVSAVGFDNSYNGTPTLVKYIPYGGERYELNYIEDLGSKSVTMDLDEELIEKMYPASVSFPSRIISADKQEYLDNNFVRGETNDGRYQIWKGAEYSDQSVTITMNYFEKTGKPLDFIILLDETLSTEVIKGQNDEMKASTYLWTHAAALRASKGILEANDQGYENQVEFIVWDKDGAMPSGLSRNYEGLKTWLSHSYTDQKCTKHEVAFQAALSEAKKASVSKDHIPVVIYMSDFGAYFSKTNSVQGYSQSTVDAIQDIADIYPLVIYPYDCNSEERAVNVADHGHAYTAADESGIMSAFGYIITDALSHIDSSAALKDELSDALITNGKLDAITDNGGGTAAVSRKGSSVTWRLLNSDGETRLNTGTLYTKSFTVPLDEDAVFSGAMPTNGDLTAGSSKMEYNRIDASDSPILKKDLGIIVRENDRSGKTIAGAEFELYQGSLSAEETADAEPVWTGRSDNSGQLNIPYGNGENQCSFPAGAVYTLKQTSAADGYLLPGFTWKLSVGSDYVVRPTTETTEDKSASGIVRSLGMASVSGRLEVYNENYTILEVLNNSFLDYDLSSISSDPDLLSEPGAYIMNGDGSWSVCSGKVEIPKCSSIKLAIPTGAGKEFNLKGSFKDTEGYTETIPVTISDKNGDITELEVESSFGRFVTDDVVRGTLAGKGETVSVEFTGGASPVPSGIGGARDNLVVMGIILSVMLAGMFFIINRRKNTKRKYS